MDRSRRKRIFRLSEILPAFVIVSMLATTDLVFAWEFLFPTSFSRANAVTQDQAENIIAVGFTDNPGKSRDWTVVKLNGADGSLIWRTDLDGGISAFDGGAFGVGVDSAGDVFVGGTFQPSSGTQDLSVVKLSGQDGSLIWRVDANGTPGHQSFFRDIGVDSSGDVFVCGGLHNADTSNDFFVMKLRGFDGSELWRFTRDGGAAQGDFANSLAIDVDGNVFSGGRLAITSTLNQFFVIKLNGFDGALLWEADPGTVSSGDRVNSVAVDSLGNLIAGGAFVSGVGVGLDFTTIKFNGLTGSELWRSVIDKGLFSDEVFAVTVDHNDDVLTAGRIANSGTGQSDYAVVKLAGDDGSVVWQNEIDGTASALDEAWGVQVDSDNNVISVGLVANLDTGADFFVVKHDGITGDAVWSFTRDGNSSFDIATALALDSNGNVTAVGSLDSLLAVIKLSGETGESFDPDMDSDSDGVPDSEDLCPFTPVQNTILEFTAETLVAADNDFADLTLEAVVVTTEGLPVLDGEVEFVIAGGSNGLLDGCSGLTNSLGLAQCQINGVPPDVYTVDVVFHEVRGCYLSSSETTFLVVFDPDQPRATGGGFIYPDLESTLPAETTAHKAHFGFMVRIDNKSKAAAGNLEFQYQAAGINLKSQGMEWYTVSNNRAMFQGTATINGAGLYTFRVAATDGDLTGGLPDSFDIRIWAGTDTESDPVHKAKNDLAGGNIVVHKK